MNAKKHLVLCSTAILAGLLFGVGATNADANTNNEVAVSNSAVTSNVNVASQQTESSVASADQSATTAQSAAATTSQARADWNTSYSTGWNSDTSWDGITTWTYRKADGTEANNEWLWINGSWYYFEGNDMAANGWYYAPWYGQENAYYFDANGHYETNCWHSTSNGKDQPLTWTYSKADGTRAEDEWLWINGSWYYFAGAEMAANGWHYAPWYGQENAYYFDANGHYETNCWHYTSNGNNQYPTWTYSKADGTRAEDEWLWINGSWYYFAGADMAANGWYYAPWHGQENAYYFDGNGHYETNCWHSTSNGNNQYPTWTYSKADGTRAENEWLCINGSWYYFEGDDMAANGWYYAPWNGQDKEYYFDVWGHCLS